MSNTDLALEVVTPIEENNQLIVGDTGITAQRKGDYAAVFNRDGTEIFTFNLRACPFEPGAIAFLIEVYTIGYNKGRVIGRDLFKAKLRDMLGSEL